jgi:hypothetical protein
MNGIKRLGAIILFGTVVAAAQELNHDTWTKTNETKDGIVIYARLVRNTEIKELKANCVMDAPPLNVWQAVMDKDTYKDSSKYVVVDKVFRTTDQNIWYNYQLVAAPMFAKRDYTLRYESYKDPARMYYRLVWRTAKEYAPPQEKGVVRLSVCDGSFIIEPYEGGKKSYITYWVCTDPGGMVPAWAANLVNRSSLPDFIRTVHKQSLLFRDKQKGGGHDNH